MHILIELFLLGFIIFASMSIFVLVLGMVMALLGGISSGLGLLINRVRK